MGTQAHRRGWATDRDPVAEPVHGQFSRLLVIFVCGYSIQPFNHYIVWPQLAASVKVVLIRREFFLDRRRSAATALAAVLLLTAGIAGLWFSKTLKLMKAG